MHSLLDSSAAMKKELHLRSGVILSIFIGITLVFAVVFGLVSSFGHFGKPQHPLPQPSVSSDLPPSATAPVTPAPRVATPQLSTIPSPSAKSLTPAASAGSAPQASSALPKSVSKTTSLHASYVVQVAAVARRKDARSVVASLRKHGFSAQIRTAAHDRFFHVQLGPFHTEQQAQAMRHKVMAAGYRTILKSK